MDDFAIISDSFELIHGHGWCRGSWFNVNSSRHMTCEKHVDDMLT